VHRKYIKIKGKTYGPYYYESYREEGKIKKRYIKFPNDKRRVKDSATLKYVVFIYIFLVIALLFFTFLKYFDVGIFKETPPELLLAPYGPSIGTDGNANLVIYDDSDLDDPNNFGAKIKRYSFCNSYCAQKNKPSPAVWTIVFYANYTDNLANPIDNTLGSCSISYNIGQGYGISQAMVYDSVSLLWKTSTNFPSKGINSFQVSCTSSLGNPLLENAFVVTNSEPYIMKTASGFIDFNADGLEDTLRCVEDQICIYNFSANVSEDDMNDVLVYGYSLDKVNTAERLANFTINADNGILVINVTNNDNTGAKKAELNVRDSESPLISSFLRVQIDPVNDAPNFLNLENKSFNMTEPFEYVILADDEEKNFPLSFSIDFLSCTTAQWSTRGSTNCVLFDNAHYRVNDTAINISFIPTRDDVGNYVINISARDSLNAVRSEIINFTVLNINSPPVFEDVCGTQRSSIEDASFSCIISAFDGDEINALTFSSNATWFLDRQVISVGKATNFRGSANVNFRASDSAVGSWQINISVNDTGSPVGVNSSVIPFFVANIPDSVYLDNILDITAYTSNLYSIPINATDDDLLISDKNVYDEAISFSSSLAWVNVRSLGVIPATNKTKAVIEFDPKIGGVGSHSVTITARDKTGNVDSKTFTLTIVNNNPPVWNFNTPVTNVLTEDNLFSLNLRPYVSDADNDPLVFSFFKDKPFPSFSLDPLTGLISFTSIDVDVGEHILFINVSDGKASVPLGFNFTVYNVPDNPIIIKPLDGNNVTINLSNSNMNTTEDNSADIFFFVKDDDFAIPNDQKDFYRETINVELNIEGPNTGLFSFRSAGIIPPNQELFRTSFLPRKSDVGIYNISIKVKDVVNNSDFIEFNLTINPINHAPVINNLINFTSTINRNLFFDINSTDIEDGFDDGGNLTYRLEYLAGNSLFNSTTFNNTAGIINITFNSTDAGLYIFRVIVNDSLGTETSGEFGLSVYGTPKIDYPDANFMFNLQEGSKNISNFNASHFIGDNLTYEFYLHNILREKRSHYGDGHNFILDFTPGYEDETYGRFGNFTMIVYPADYKDLNSSRTWNANITHANAPMVFAGFIGDKQGSVGQPILVNLSSYFFDIDAFDPHYNQSVNFSIGSSENVSKILSQVSDWTLTLNAFQPADEKLNIMGGDLEKGSLLTNVTSNSFNVVFVQPPQIVITRPTSSSSSVDKPVLLKLVLPGPVSVKKGEAIILPIELDNEASTTLSGIQLTSLFAFKGALQQAKTSFSKDFISELASGKSENVTLKVETGLLEVGLYEINVNASVASPTYQDWGKIYINVLKGDTLVEKLVFTEEFIAQNPECAEIKELVDESKKYLDNGDSVTAQTKLDEAINACKLSISQQSYFSTGRLKSKFQDRIFIYLLITTVLSIVLGITYYVYRKTAIRRAVLEAQNINVDEKNYSYML